MALRTFSRAFRETERGPLLMTYETVEGATPASAATSLRVTLVFRGWAASREWLLFRPLFSL